MHSVDEVFVVQFAIARTKASRVGWVSGPFQGRSLEEASFVAAGAARQLYPLALRPP